MNPGQFKDQMLDTTIDFGSKVLAFIPNLVLTLLILGLGYLVSKGLKKIGTILLQRLGFDRLSDRVGLQRILAQASIRATPSEILGNLIFWFFMLMFLVSTAEILGLKAISQTLDAFVRYVPNLIAAVAIFVLGMTFAHFLRDGVRRAAEGLGVEYAKGLSDLLYGLFIVVVGSLAVSQLRIETALFNRVVEIILMATGAALALGLGLGTKDIAKHIIAGVYIRDLYRQGMNISVGEDSGALQDVGRVVTRIKTPEGLTIYIPNARLAEMVVREKSA